MSQLLLATEGGQVVAFDTATREHRCVYQSSDNEAMMGIEAVGPHLYVASLSRVYQLRLDDFSKVAQTRLYDPTPDFHQMSFVDGFLYLTATKDNQIWLFEPDLRLARIHQVTPPDPRRKVEYKKNYNHLNHIVREGDRFFVSLNWLTTTQYANSGVLVTDADLEEIERFEFGWEIHDFQFLDGKKIAICATSSKGKRVKHPYRRGRTRRRARRRGSLLQGHRPRRRSHLPLRRTEDGAPPSQELQLDPLRAATERLFACRDP